MWCCRGALIYRLGVTGTRTVAQGGGAEVRGSGAFGVLSGAFLKAIREAKKGAPGQRGCDRAPLALRARGDPRGKAALAGSSDPALSL